MSFVPGFVILKIFKLETLSLLSTILMSIGLSLVASMLVGLAINELYLALGLSQPLSIVPVTAGISIFTLIMFLVAYRKDFSINFANINDTLTIGRYWPLIIALAILPILSVLGAVFANVSIMIIVSLAIAFLAIASAASRKFIPTKFYPLVIFSISLSILLLNVLISRYIIGDDASLEFYVFKITQIRGFWGSIDATTNDTPVLFYNSMLSVTVLPDVYSILMNVKDELLFKILYPFIFSLVPLVLYKVYKNEIGNQIALLSTFFFVFTVNAFFGELISVNRQIVGEFFLVLSILVWLEKNLPIREKRILLVIFGIAIAFSHYSIAIIYLVFVSAIIIISSFRPKLDNVFNAPTVLSIFVFTILWFTFSTESIIDRIISTIQTTFSQLNGFKYNIGAGSVGAVTTIPQVFTIASWVNLSLSVLVNVLLAEGILSIIILHKTIKISNKFKSLIIFATIILTIALLFPTFAETLNFTRFYAISLLFLSPCLVIGALSLGKLFKALGKKLKSSHLAAFSKIGEKAIVLVAILLSAYFLSQSGFTNYVTGGAIHSQTFDYYRILNSDDPQVSYQFYGAVIQEQDACSANWIGKYTNDSLTVYSSLDNHALITHALIPNKLIIPLTDETNPEAGSSVYFDSLNLVKGVFPSSNGLLNTSQIETSQLNSSDLVYSNGNSEVWAPVGSG